jgi:hypothetical protein
MTNTERRRLLRYPVQVELLVRVEGGAPVRGRSADISLDGIFVILPDPPAVGQKVQIEIASTGEPIAVEGVVVHSVKGYGIGVRLLARSAQIEERLERLTREFLERQEGGAS